MKKSYLFRWSGLCGLICCALLFLSACDSSANAPDATPTPERVNGFGTAANHSHALLAFSSGSLVLATHFGLFHSTNEGKSWQMVAAGPHQPMEDLMTFSLTASTLNPQRIYVLTQRVYNNPKGTLGLYTSTDQGQSWRLALPTSELGDMYFAAAGNESPDEVYVYLTHRGPDALKVSKDGGQHFSTVGTLPLGNLQGLYALPGAPGQLLIYGNDGIARSSDGGQHWETVAGVSGAVFSVASAGPGQPIYASGDAGITRSTDGGKTFNQVYSQSSYNSLSVPATQPQTIYGKLGSGVYRSTDGGQSWQPLPQLKKSLESVVADPGNADQVYLAANYPTEVYHYNAQSSAWTSLTPKP